MREFHRTKEGSLLLPLVRFRFAALKKAFGDHYLYAGGRNCSGLNCSSLQANCSCSRETISGIRMWYALYKAPHFENATPPEKLKAIFSTSWAAVSNPSSRYSDRGPFCSWQGHLAK